MIRYFTFHVAQCNTQDSKEKATYSSQANVDIDHRHISLAASKLVQQQSSRSKLPIQALNVGVEVQPGGQGMQELLLVPTFGKVGTPLIM
jgi:hypothetical protein